MHEMVTNGPDLINLNPTKSDQIKPNPAKKTMQPRSRRRPFDQNWRGRASTSAERVGCGEMRNG
jgi:hypothetical protein